MLECIDIEQSVATNLAAQAAAQDYWRNTVVVIITNHRRDKVLFVRSIKNDTWGPPKGGLEDGDRLCIEACAKREVAEEIGVQAYHLQYLGYLGSAYGERNQQGNRLGKLFHCVHMVITPRVRTKPNPAENVNQCLRIGSLTAFNKLKMKPARREIWLAAMQAAGVPWALRA